MWAEIGVDGAAAADLVTLEGFDNPDARSFRVGVPGPGEERDALTRLLARSIVWGLTAPSDTAFDAWLARLEGGPAHDEATRKELEAYLLADFKPSESNTRANGAVIEHLWALLAPELEGEWGRPLYVEHDHFSVIDHGGDGFSLYEMVGSLDLRFRLWESKCHEAEKKSVTSTVTDAAKQLQRSGPEYIARASKPLQLHDDERVRLLAGTMVKLWTSRDARSAVGVSVGTAAGIPARPFSGLRREFPSEPFDLGRLEGLVIEVESLDQFVADVRARIMEGIE